MAYQMYAQQAKGTLTPGQMISVNKYDVQVERFLSQGGFAHVYLVRTAEPVFNTTHHVLKRIAVANGAMLNEVKKEVDIMRILKGHPNIVYLIDAAWHKMANGTFEVFILMEFCSGGGIIDMMNRRLRERLTESEILQIFVDVCEGLAAMHNLRPPLLHRDLKVENILQASATSYKLCDFGSAMPVSPRPPSTTQEIRALETDLNKHTTLQYRAPEMVDVFLRRPIDEKSDVWALGVLLYKLCYYTTPFEEHGVLAILNVQYKFPPYPMYSQQLNTLIASMLREHGVHRPTVFEVLDTVHRMRSTKSRFTYNLPPRQPLSPRKLSSPMSTRNTASSAKSADLVASPRMNGIQAREKVLEAIEPMRRGRPSSPTKGWKTTDDVFGLIDSIEGGPRSVDAAKAHKSGLASISATRSSLSSMGSGLGDAWEVPGTRGDKKQATVASNGFGDAFEASSSLASQSPSRPAPARSGSSSLRPPSDAFDSLNMFPSPTAQTLTLGEAQKAGLTVSKVSPSPQPSSHKYSASPSPSLTSSSLIPPENLSSIPRRDASPLLKPKLSDQALAAEQRFPSLEELDAGKFGSSFNSSSTRAPSSELMPPQLPPRPSARQDSGKATSTSFYPASVTGALRQPAGLGSPLPAGPRSDGVRSQQVTGTAMRDARKMPVPTPPIGSSSSLADKAKTEQFTPRHHRMEAKSREKLDFPSKPVLTRKHRSSVSVKHTQRTGSSAVDPSSPTKPASALLTNPPKDWLTGADDNNEGVTFDNDAVLRASPEKHTSILHNPVPPDAGQEAVRATSPTKRKPVPVYRPKPIEVKKAAPEKRSRKAPAGLTDNWSPVTSDVKSSSSSDEGPEDAVGLMRPAKSPLKESGRQRIGHQARQGSVHDLVDLWGGSGSSLLQKSSPTKQDKRSSMFALPKSASGGSSEQTTMTATTSLLPTTLNARPPSTSAVSVSRKPSLDTRRPPSDHFRQPSSPARAHQNSPSPIKSRPQSMLLLPVQKSVSDSVGASPSPQSSLSAPGDKIKTAHRRSSISDIVSRYEAIGVQEKTGSQSASVSASVAAPYPAVKPMRLRVVSPSSISSPTTASTRFPQISPMSSPASPARTSFPASLDLPVHSLSPAKEERPQRAVSPGLKPAVRVHQNSSPLPPEEREPTRVPVLALAAELQRNERPERERFERKPLIPLTTASSASAKEQAVPALSRAGQAEDVRSPSPERPYQGVSKLIDQWQKKSEEPDGARGGAGGFKSTGSRFRRDGVRLFD